MSFKKVHGNSVVSGDFKELEELVKNLKEKFYVDIGFLGEESETVEGDLTIAGIAAVHEFGTDKAGRGNKTTIPKRSIIKMPLMKKQKEIVKFVEKKYPELLSKGDIEGIFKLIGIAGEAQIQEAFDTGGFGEWPQLADSTIKQKGSSAILIDEGTMRKAVTSKVGKG
jgi:hypothetical protein